MQHNSRAAPPLHVCFALWLKNCALQALEELNVSDNLLESLPAALWQALPQLRTVMLYGNLLKGLPAGCFASQHLKGETYQGKLCKVCCAWLDRSTTEMLCHLDTNAVTT